MRTTIALLAFALCCFSADAAVPRQINYQGFLTGANSVPVNAGVSMSFSVYDVAAGGSALYTETQTVTVSNGVFNVLIGSVNQLLLPFDVPYFLGVRVGADNEMVPRSPIAASAYTIRAATADALAPGATVAGSQITGQISGS